MASVGDLVAALDAWFPPELAEEWDAVGLLAGRRRQPVGRVALAVDATDATLAWAIEAGAQLLFVHHPLYLRGTTNIDGDSPQGDLVQRAIESGLAIFVAHTNADVARPGVSDELATTLGLTETRPIRRHPSSPHLGIGRYGVLEQPTTLAEFAGRVAWALPKTHAGLRWAGDPERRIVRVALCGGAGGDLLDEVDADVYVTSDLRHHVALDYLASRRASLIDIPHAAAEWLWLTPLARRLEERFTSLTAVVCPIITDPWSGHHA
jgi:dinuclear metal center YbgI/SA1388 family protein